MKFRVAYQGRDRWGGMVYRRIAVDVPFQSFVGAAIARDAAHEGISTITILSVTKCLEEEYEE